MENVENQTPVNNQSASIEPINPNRVLRQPLDILLIIFLVVASFVCGYFYEHSKAKTKENNLQAQITSLEKTANSAKSQSTGLQAAEPVGTMVSQVLSYLSTYKQQNGQYPANETTDLDKLVWSYNYNFVDGGGPDLTCPLDSRFLTYVSLANQTTHKNDTFTLYYCNGSKMSQKTQADITQ
ncbi:MAG TPA: hypothetical protein VFN31_01480 [Candidatus Saccharimonadales bacterium]|nr:hypothetical protein [Candidatus Saccharimonadales bacterium]